MRYLPIALAFVTATSCSGGTSAPDVAQGPGSGLDADTVDGLHTADLAPASGLSTGALLPEQSRRMGAFTDLARGKKATATNGTTLGGLGPTSEYAKQGYWSTLVFPSELVLDLGATFPVSTISFESSWRGDVRYIPAWQGAGAYVLSLSVDGTSWTDLQAVAPVDGDHFVHVVAGASTRYVRLRVLAPSVVGNEVKISMLRVLNWEEGESTAIDAARQYFSSGQGPFCIFAKSCPSGWTNNGSAGIILSASSSCPYTAGTPYATGWNWCHPQLCCKP